MLLVLAIPVWAGEQTILITSNDASGVYFTSKGGVKMEMSGGMNNEGFMVQRHYDQINFRSYNFKIKKIVFRCLDNAIEGDNDSFYWGPTTMYIAPNSSVNNVVAGRLTTPYNNSTYMALWESSPTYPDGLPIGQQLTIKCQGHPVRFAYIEITIDKEDGDMYELVTNTNQIVTGDKTYMLVHRRQSTDTQGDAFSSNQENESTSGNFESTKVDLFNNGFLARATGDVMFLRFSTGGTSSYPYRIIAGGAYLRTEASDESSPTSFATKRLTRVANVPSNTAYVNTSLGINGSSTGGTNGFDWYAMLTYEATTSYRIRHYNGKMQFRNITSNSTQNTNLALQRVFLYKPAQKYEVFTATDGNGTITLRDGIVVDGTHNYSQMMDNVTFIVAPVSGYKIKNVTITNLTDNTVITPTITTTTLGQNYAFSMPGSNVRIYAEFEEVQYRNISMVVKPSSLCGNIFLTDGYLVQNDNVKSFEGENVVFNVVANYIDILNEAQGKYELSYVTVTNNTTHEETILAAIEVGKYKFTMPDADVTITAYFYDNVTTPLYLLGTANGEEWHTYGPRFNYDDDNTSDHYGEYYIDVYFKGTGDFGTDTGNDWGEFRVSWLVDPNDDWSQIKNRRAQGHPDKLSVDPLTNQLVCQNGGKYRLGDGEAYVLYYDDGWTEYYGNWTDQEDYMFTLDPGIYRIYVGTQTSSDAGHLGLNVLKAVKRPIVLILDPAGGATAAEALEVSKNQEVILAGDIYSKIKAIKPQEADGNFKYMAVKNNTADEPVASTTTATTTLTEVNDGETVTELRGYNYLGWIVAADAAFYKVIETPLSWIEDKGEVGNEYTVSDELVIVHIINRPAYEDYPEQRLIWAKDQGNRSICPTYIMDGQTDYMRNLMQMQNGDWDQSNWVMLKFPDGTDLEDETLNYAIGNTIKAGTLKGCYIDDQNYTIEVESIEIGNNTVDYQPNVFCTANFLDANLNLDGEEGHAVGPTNTHYFFMNPKVQEVADVIAAIWNGEYFVVAAQAYGQNAADLDGAFTVDWKYNKNYDVSSSLVTGQGYAFRGVLNLKPIRRLVVGKDVDADNNKNVMPFNLDDSTITSVNDINANKTVSCVKYYNITGMESNSPFDGVNIVVTRYTDGTFTTTKVLR